VHTAQKFSTNQKMKIPLNIKPFSPENTNEQIIMSFAVENDKIEVGTSPPDSWFSTLQTKSEADTSLL